MKKVLVIHNPNSGNGKGAVYAEKIKIEFEKQTKGEFNIRLFESPSIQHVRDEMQRIKAENDQPDTLVILGGDGTIGAVVNAMFQADIKIPVATFPLGTANDFSVFIKMKRNVKKLVRAVINNQTTASDVAVANGKYIINVIASGAFTHSYMLYDRRSKRILGKFAYYIKCFFASFKLQSQYMSFNIDGNEVRDEVFVYFITNSSSTGGLKKVAPNAQIDDGYFEFVAIKKCSFFQFPFLFFKILAGKHLKNKNIIYRRGRQFSIKCVHKQKDNFVYTDFDGDKGDAHPLQVKVLKGALTLYTNRKELYNGCEK